MVTMRIRGEEMSKMGDVIRRYGERLEKDSSGKDRVGKD
jgi:hypothetical protein